MPSLCGKLCPIRAVRCPGGTDVQANSGLSPRLAESCAPAGGHPNQRPPATRAARGPESAWTAMLRRLIGPTRIRAQTSLSGQGRPGGRGRVLDSKPGGGGPCGRSITPGSPNPARDAAPSESERTGHAGPRGRRSVRATGSNICGAPSPPPPPILSLSPPPRPLPLSPSAAAAGGGGGDLGTGTAAAAGSHPPPSRPSLPESFPRGFAAHLLPPTQRHTPHPPPPQVEPQFRCMLRWAGPLAAAPDAMRPPGRRP